MRRRWVIALVAPAIPIGLMALSIANQVRTFNGKSPFVQVTGTVAHLDCGNHGQYTVRFSAGGQPSVQASANQFLRANCQDLRIGQQIPMWYSAADPTYVSFVRPDRASSTMTGELKSLFLIAYPLFAGFLMLAMKVRLSASESTPRPTPRIPPRPPTA